MNSGMSGSTCQVCAAAGEQWLTHRDMVLRRCLDCGLVFMDPMPDDRVVDSLYTDAYSGATEVYFAKVASKMRRSRRRARWLSRRVSGLRFLDIGCNGGFMVEAMRQLGFESHGIDLDPVSIAWAQEHYPGGRFRVTSAERFELTGDPFDIVYCSEVIEHSPDVNRFVASVAASMVPGGMLYLTTPDISHWRRPRDITQWDGFDPPSHCVYFNPRNLAQLLSRHGLHVVERRLALKPGIKVLARRARV